MSSSSAIEICDACLKYGSGKKEQHVLRNFNMTVTSGSIYSLLGASGCGKTTLLNCIVRRNKLNSGEIQVLGKRSSDPSSGIPGSTLGYMPQDIALYPEFTIKDAIHFFGRIHKMSRSKISEKMNFLIQFFELPSPDKFIRDLSGGQKRRVSFAVALLHDPPVVLLDEPTVGLDPLLRQSIWKHLLDMTASNGQTVVITTHYIEEARQAHKLGLMRSGRLLAEDSPDKILEKANATSLENAFLYFCYKDEKRNSTVPVEEQNHIPTLLENGLPLTIVTNTLEPDTTTNSVGNLSIISINTPGNIPYNHSSQMLINICQKDNTTPIEKNIKTYFHTFFCLEALLRKQFVQMWRNLTMMIFLIALPMCLVIVFCTTIGQDPKGLKMGIVNNENPDNPICHVTVEDEGCVYSNLSCRFLDEMMTRGVILKPYMNEDDAYAAVFNGDVWGYMSFPANYSEFMLERAFSGLNSGLDVFRGSVLRVRLDMSNQNIALALQKFIQFSFLSFTDAMVKSCDLDAAAGESPVVFEEPVFGSKNTQFMEFMAPGILVCLSCFFPMALTLVSLSTERREGMLERMIISGVSSLEIVIALMISQYVVMVSQITVMLLIMVFAYNVPALGPIGWLYTLLILQGTAGMGLGFFIASIIKTEQSATETGIGTFFTFFLLSSIVWPLEGMPMVARYVSSILPNTLAAEAARSIMLRGWGFLHSSIWPAYAISTAWILIFFIGAIIVFRKENS